MVVTKAGFLKAWKGNVTLEQSKAQLITGYQNKLLSAEKAKTIRGAFWGSILNLVGSILNIIVPGSGVPFQLAAFAISIAEGDWVSAISAAINVSFSNLGSSLFNAFKGAFQGITQALGPVGSILSGIGQVVSGVGHALSTVYQSVNGFFGNITHSLTDFLHGSIGISSSVAASITETAVSIGVNFGVSKGLESIGVNPQIAGFFGNLAAGAAIGASKPVDAAKGLTQAKNIQTSIQQAITIQNVGSLGLGLGLDSGFTQIIGLSLAAIQGITIPNPQTTLERAFAQVRPQITSSLAQYGVQELGKSLGVDSRISGLIGAPISGALNVGLQQGGATGTQIINAINQGIQTGIANLAIEAAGQALDLNPLFTGLTARAFLGALEGALRSPANPVVGFFDGITQSFTKSLFNALTFGQNQSAPNSPLQNALYLQRVIRFSDIVRDHGIQAAIEDHLSAILERDAVESVFRQGGIVQLLTNQAAPVIDAQGNTVAIKVNISSNAKIYLDPTSTNVIGRDYGNIKERGTYGVDPVTGEFKLLSGRIYQDFDGGFTVTYVENGVAKDTIPVPNSQNFRFHLTARDPEVGIIIDSFHFDAKVYDHETGTISTYQNGHLIGIQKFGTTLGQTQVRNEARFYQKVTDFIERVRVQSGASLAGQLRTAQILASQKHGLPFSAEFISAKSAPAIIRTREGTLEIEVEQGQDYAPDNELTLIGRDDSTFKLSLSGNVSTSFIGDTSASLAIHASAQTSFSGVDFEAGAFGEFEGALDLISSKDARQLLHDNPTSFKKGVHTESATSNGSKLSIDSFLEGQSVVQKSTITDINGNKQVITIKFTPAQNPDLQPAVEPVLQSQIAGLSVLQALLSGTKTSLTAQESSNLKTFMRNTLDQISSAQPGTITGNLDVLAGGFSQSASFAVNKFEREMSNVLFGALTGTVTNPIAFPSINLGQIFGQSLFNPDFFGAG